jgi:hypothetical protein
MRADSFAFNGEITDVAQGAEKPKACWVNNLTKEDKASAS